ncbi:glycosyltransferase [Aquimarina algicola]|nr:glycosyltransferase [Aquimarina algicola]
MNNSLYAGGAEKILQTLLRQLDPDRYAITLYSIKKEHFDTNIYPAHIQYHYIFDQNNGEKGFLSSLWMRIINKMKLSIYHSLSPKTFYKLFVKGKYDIEVAYIEGYSTKIISGSSNPNSKKIAWVHIDLEANHWTSEEYKSLEQEIEAYKKFDHIASVSKSVQDAFSRKFNIQDKLTVKYNPVDQEEIKGKALQTQHEAKTKPIRLITIGRLEDQKGYDRLVRIVNRLKEEYAFELWILGEGTQRKILEEYIHQHDLQEIITLYGFQSNPYSFLDAADAFVCSSRSEGFSTVVTEALILGKPVVATDCSGMTELLGDSEYGLITENDEDALYQGLKKFLGDQSLRAHYAEKSKERSKDFDIKVTVQEIEKMWYE